jgi:hypothetical protein
MARQGLVQTGWRDPSLPSGDTPARFVPDYGVISDEHRKKVFLSTHI